MCAKSYVLQARDMSETSACSNRKFPAKLLVFPSFKDINECMDSPCGFNANCSNSIGSFDCACQLGYEGSGTNCTGRFSFGILLS